MATQTQNTKERPNIVLPSELVTTGALFNIKTEDRIENGPIMSGSIEVQDETMPVSGFHQIAESGLVYLGLSFGAENNTHYFGKLFRNENKRSVNAPDYTGYIALLPCTEKNQYTNEEWDNAPQLRVSGWRKRSADGTARIALSIAPSEVKEDELAF